MISKVNHVNLKMNPIATIKTYLIWERYLMPYCMNAHAFNYTVNGSSTTCWVDAMVRRRFHVTSLPKFIQVIIPTTFWIIASQKKLYSYMLRWLWTGLVLVVSYIIVSPSVFFLYHNFQSIHFTRSYCVLIYDRCDMW